MLIGLIFAVAACIVWGLIFIIPELLGDVSVIEVVLGRYLTYGIFSCLLLFKEGFKRLKVFTPRIWGRALMFSLCANPLYYFFVIIGLRFASPSLTVLILGLIPVAIVIYGNWHVREISYRQMTLPFSAILLGLICVNGMGVDWTFQEHSITEYLLGFLGICVSLLSWTIYVIHNARFLKKNPQVPSSKWATVLGVATLFWVVVIAIIFHLVFHMIDLTALWQPTPDTMRYWIGSAILGIVCSWLGCFLWNLASTLLPVSLMGPLMIFETLFGLIYVYIMQKRWPPLLEAIGAVLMFAGVLLSIQVFRRSAFVIKSAQQQEDDIPHV